MSSDSMISLVSKILAKIFAPFLFKSFLEMLSIRIFD